MDIAVHDTVFASGCVVCTVSCVLPCVGCVLGVRMSVVWVGCGVYGACFRVQGL